MTNEHEKTKRLTDPGKLFLKYTELRSEYVVLKFLLSILMIVPIILKDHPESGEVGNAISAAVDSIKKRIDSIAEWMDKAGKEGKTVINLLKATSPTEKKQ